MNKFILLLAAILFTSVQINANANAKLQSADEIYRIKNIKIENISDDLIAGKQTAIDDGKKIAFDELIKRFVNYGYITKAPVVTAEQIDDSIQDVNVIEELITDTRYEARMNYNFEPSKILKILNVENIGILPKKEEYLLIPIIVENGKTIPWHKLWFEAWKKFPAKSATLPFGDLDDIKAINSEELSILNYTGVDKLARRYKMPIVVLAEAEYSIPKNILYVRLKRFETEPKLVSEYKFSGEFGTGSKELFSTAAQAISADISKNGIPRDGKALENPFADQEIDIEYNRDYQSERSANQKTMLVTVMTRSLSDWSAIRRKLINTKLISDLAVTSFSAKQTEIKLFYIGEIEELQRSLAINGLDLIQNGDKYIIDRTK
jgi:hypothetical protein